MSENLELLINNWIEEHKQEMIDELKAWVSHPSVSRADLAEPNAPYGPDCRKMLDFALERGRHYGFRTEDHDGYCGSVLYGERENEIGLVCHLDVVPEGDHWIYPPYNPTEKDGFLIGRGVGDNKGSAIICLFLMRFFKENHIPLRNTLRLMLGCAEETGMADYSHYVNVLHGPLPAVSIVADAAFPVCYAQKGGYDAEISIPAGKNIIDVRGGSVRNIVPDTAELVISGIRPEEASELLSDFTKVEVNEEDAYVRIIAHGKAGHAAFPHPEEKNNAIVILAEAAAALERKTGLDLSGAAFIADALSSPFGEGLGIAYEDEMSGKLTLNPGVIRKAGDALQIDIDIRYPVSDQADEITRTIREKLDSIGGSLEVQSVSKPYYISPDDPKVEALLDAYYSITGDDSKPYTMGGGTYSRVIPNAISFGPSLGHKSSKRPEFLPEGHGNAHGPDETLHIESWLTGFRIYIQSILRLDKIENL